MFKSVTYNALVPGNRLLVLGAVHGNEKCGTQAIQQIMQRLDSGALELSRGTVTFVPICNPLAYEQDVRQTAQNLNRSMMKRDNPSVYEFKLQNALCPLLENCDVLLDVHSYTAGGPAFVMRGPDDRRDREEAFTAMLGVGYMLCGWEDAYANAGIPLDPIVSTGTTEYARNHGATAVTVECGQHKEAAAIPVALRAIYGALAYAGITDEKIAPTPDFKRCRMRQVYYKVKEGDFTRPLNHLEEVKAGEALVIYKDGEVITAPWNSRVIMPKLGAVVGEEWFYLAVDE